jgi:chemosensory pili system protein ChpA (sensor histidine kinase/response regulator)
MARKVDHEVLVGFLEEARCYLPQILHALDQRNEDRGQPEVLAEAHRHAHCIKGASSMVGLIGLSHIAYQLEEALEDLSTGQLPSSPEALSILRRTVAVIGLYLDGVESGMLREQPLLDEVTRAYRRLRGLPAEDDSAAVSHVLAQVEARVPASSSCPMIDLGPEDESLQEPLEVPKPSAPPALEGSDVVTETPTMVPAESAASDKVLARIDDETPSFLATSEVPPSMAEDLVLPDHGPDQLPISACAEPDFPLAEFTASEKTTEAIPVSPEPASQTESSQETPFTPSSAGNDPTPTAVVTTEELPDLGTFTPPTVEDPPFPEPPAPAFPVPVSSPASPPVASEDNQDEVSPELLEVFALEAEEHLRNIHTLLPILEQQPRSKTHLQEVRRSAHTLKGSAAMVGFRSITKLAHRMEDLLDLLYDGQFEVTQDILALLFASTDALEDMTAGKGEGSVVQELYSRYEELLGLAATRAPAASATPGEEVPAAEGEETSEEEEPAEKATAAARRTGQFVRVPIERLDELVKLVSELVIARNSFEQRMTLYARQVEELQLSNERLRRVATKLETQYEARALISGRLSLAGSGPGNAFAHSPTSFQTYGFDELEFDRYTEFHLLSRELSETTTDVQTVSNELGHLNGDFESYLNRQARLSSELQDKLMRVRMVPLATLASRLHRTVRSVAAQQDKQVAFVLEGEDIEVDKTVLEEMADPLLHLLRNAVDHGIEMPAERLSKGKPVQGTVRVHAKYEGTQVVIRITDDGGGVDPEVLRAAAIKGGFVQPGEAAKLTHSELLTLVFLPGFSTAREISEISGRGVGLDIVKAHVHKLKGTLSLTSTPGQGATFTIRLPMTLAITRALLVRAHGQTFAIPLPSVTQILRLDESIADRIGGEEVVRIGGKVYPRYSLGKILELKQPADETEQRPPVVILDVGEKQVALIVDKLLGGREIVVKNLGTHVRYLRGVTGATLMGDGTVVLILNPNELIQTTASSRGPQVRLPQISTTARSRQDLRVMIVDDSPSVRRVVTTLIKSVGWTPVAAKDGLDALEILHRSTELPDVVVLDIEMPRMDGYELLTTLKGQASYRRIPVVMVTSRSGEKHRRKALDLGASGYVVKPYQDEALLNTLRTLVRESSEAETT